MEENKNLNPYFAEFEAEVQSLRDAAGEAAQLYADGDKQGACNVINVMHYNVTSVKELREALVMNFEQQGFQPGL